MSMTVAIPPHTAAVEPVEKSSLWVTPGSRKCTWASIKPGRRCRPVASMTCLASGSVSSAPMATNLPSAIATPPRSVASGVTMDPFFTTRSAFMVCLPRVFEWCRRHRPAPHVSKYQRFVGSRRRPQSATARATAEFVPSTAEGCRPRQNPFVLVRGCGRRGRRRRGCTDT
jgi:hypothetical protein